MEVRAYGMSYCKQAKKWILKEACVKCIDFRKCDKLAKFAFVHTEPYKPIPIINKSILTNLTLHNKI